MPELGYAIMALQILVESADGGSEHAQAILCASVEGLFRWEENLKILDGSSHAQMFPIFAREEEL